MNKDTLIEIETVKSILLSSEHAVFFGGAGVSTDSGIPDFRGNGGVYASGENTEYYLSNSCLVNEPEKFFKFFRKNMLFQNAKPNDTHKALADLEKRGIIKAVITQNIDGLHQKAGSNRVIELHGTADRFYCTNCKKVYTDEVLSGGEKIPRCDTCGGLVRPDVTLYGEGLDGFNFSEAEYEISKADVLMVGGSSLVVEPAASLIDLFQGKCLVIINYSPTPYDYCAKYVIRESLSEVFNILSGK